MNEIPDLRVNIECVIGVPQKQDIDRLAQWFADRKSLDAESPGDGLRKAFGISGFRLVSDCTIHKANLL